LLSRFFFFASQSLRFFFKSEALSLLLFSPYSLSFSSGSCLFFESDSFSLGLFCFESFFFCYSSSLFGLSSLPGSYLLETSDLFFFSLIGSGFFKSSFSLFSL